VQVNVQPVVLWREAKPRFVVTAHFHGAHSSFTGGFKLPYAVMEGSIGKMLNIYCIDVKK
jgi:hypothetical protein